MYENGIGIPQDKARAAKRYTQACNGGNMKGCNNLGLMYYKGEGVPQNKTRAVKLVTQACKGGSQKACVNLQQIQ